MKRLFLFVLVVVMCLATIVSEAAFSGDFYRARDAYAMALDSGDNHAIISNVEKMVSLMPNPSSPEEYRAIIWAVYQGGLASERVGDYPKAREYYNKFISYAQYLQDNYGEEHSENIRGFKTLLSHIESEPALYFASSQPRDTVFYGAKNEEKYGTFNGMAVSAEKTGKDVDMSICNAYSLYVSFFKEDISSFSYKIPTGCKYLQIAWNVPDETYRELESIANGSQDEYIKRNLTYLASRGEKIFLRFGAEVNAWEAIPEDSAQREVFITTFKSAYTRIANLARTISPNVALVYSPNDISNWYVDSSDFYPGDEYVDWVGISCYPNRVTTASGKIGDYADAFYCRGVYENSLMRIKNVVDAFGDRKPILISECGFAYGADGIQNTEHAVRMCKEFYTYVNMVYPQVKGIFYFNADIGKQFSLDSNYQLKNTYMDTLANNVGIGASLGGTGAGYSKFNTIDECFDTLRLYTYAYYANGMNTSVEYRLDGNPISSQSTIPYEAKIDVSSLSLGGHTIEHRISSGNALYSNSYYFYVGRDGRVSFEPIEEEILVSIDGKYLEFDQPPVVENQRTLVPLRKIFEALGASVDWNGETQTVISQKGEIRVELTLGQNVMYVNGEPFELDVCAKAIEGRTLVPVRAVSRAMNCKVDWDGANKEVIITN